MGMLGYSLSFVPFFLTHQIGEYLFTFSIVSIVLGITNLFPIPALDGSYPIMVWFEKWYGKKKGYALMKKINTVSFTILMWLNVLCIPWIIYLWMNGAYK
jgi:membrane-associated protease RseP (regulator of RpoE activity)